MPSQCAALLLLLLPLLLLLLLVPGLLAAANAARAAADGRGAVLALGAFQQAHPQIPLQRLNLLG